MSRNKTHNQRKKERAETGYIGKVYDMIQTGELSAALGTVQMVNILHDDWCGALKGRECNCIPDVVRGTVLK